MEFVGLPEKQRGRAEDGGGEDETNLREIIGERNEFDDQPSMDDAQEDRPCHIRVENHRVKGVFYRRVRLGWGGRQWCISTRGLDWNRGRPGRGKEGGDLGGNEHTAVHSVVANDASLSFRRRDWCRGCEVLRP